MGLLKKDSDPVLEAIQKLRREVRDMTDGWRGQQSVSNDAVLAKLEQMSADVILLKRAWEKTK
jgi:uncharacterized protein YukE